MARSLRDLRRKMKAIKSTRQVTKAMELVAASKMRRAVLSAQQLRRYALTSWNILERIAQVHPGVHPFLSQRAVKRVLAILVTSDRGLCGSINTQLLRAVSVYLKELRRIDSFEAIDFVAIGKKGQQFLARNNEKVTAAFPALSNHPAFPEALPIVRIASEGFLSGTFDHVVLLYTDFVSPLVQEPTIKVLLPFSKTVLKEMLGSLFQRRKRSKEEELQATSYKLQAVKEYLFEPSQNEVLNVILPKITEIQVYQAILEAAASEHSSRMIAMRAASDNASDILDDLTLTYNQTRQAGITAELAELSGARAALS